MDITVLVISIAALIILIDNIRLRIKQKQCHVHHKSEFVKRHYKFSANTIQGQMIATINNYRIKHELDPLITDKMLCSEASRKIQGTLDDKMNDKNVGYYKLYVSGFLEPEEVLKYWMRHSLERDILQSTEVEWIGSAVSTDGDKRQFLILIA